MMDLARKHFNREVRDTLSGFKGKVAGVSAYINGCLQVLVVPPASEEGAYREGQWIDEQRLVDTKTGEALFAGSGPSAKATAGGPQRHPAQR